MANNSNPILSTSLLSLYEAATGLYFQSRGERSEDNSATSPVKIEAIFGAKIELIVRTFALGRKPQAKQTMTLPPAFTRKRKAAELSESTEVAVEEQEQKVRNSRHWSWLRRHFLKFEINAMAITSASDDAHIVPVLLPTSFFFHAGDRSLFSRCISSSGPQWCRAIAVECRRVRVDGVLRFTRGRLFAPTRTVADGHSQLINVAKCSMHG